MARVRAPELSGAGGWIGTLAPLNLQALRGKIVVLDFWTSCCVNCVRVIDELRDLEHRFRDEVVFVGVHSPKFPHEHEHSTVERAVARLGITHPVLDDPEMTTWGQYGVRGWPTVVVIDPESYVVGATSGEGCHDVVAATIEQLISTHEANGSLDRRAIGSLIGPLRGSVASQPLSFPGKVAVSGDGAMLAIADTGHQRVLVCDVEGRVFRQHLGLTSPQGLRFDGDAVIVADTGADRVVRLVDGGEPDVLASGISSPWDVLVERPGAYLVAEAGRHRLWRIDEHGARPVAGTGAENLLDGPAAEAMFAQPSGLSPSAWGVAIVDAESSALRVLTDDGNVATLVGQGLFDWGASDGGPESSALQHPMGVAADGETIYVADTFNSLIRAWSGSAPSAELGALRTLPVSGLDEPGGLDRLADGRLVVADTNNHRIVIVSPDHGAVEPIAIDESWLTTVRGAGLAATEGGHLALPYAVDVGVDAGTQQLDFTAGLPIHIEVRAEPPQLLGPGPRSWALTEPAGELGALAGQAGQGLVVLEVHASVCGPGGCTVVHTRTRHPLTVDAATTERPEV